MSELSITQQKEAIEEFGKLSISNNAKNRYTAKLKGSFVSIKSYPQESIELAICSLHKRVLDNKSALTQLET